LWLESNEVKNYYCVRSDEVTARVLGEGTTEEISHEAFPKIGSHTRTVVRECFKGDEASQ